MRVPKKYIRRFIKLLKSIEHSAQLQVECTNYYPYWGAKPINEFQKRLEALRTDAYEYGFVITNYQEVIEQNGWIPQQIWNADYGFINGLDENGTLACIAFIYRADHWNPGTLYANAANGLLLKFFIRLMDIATAELMKSDKRKLLCPYCLSVHTAPIVYGISSSPDFKRQRDFEEIYIAKCPKLKNGPTHYCYACDKWIYI